VCAEQCARRGTRCAEAKVEKNDECDVDNDNDIDDFTTIGLTRGSRLDVDDNANARRMENDELIC
jgi:hypothetical protein